MCKGVKFKGQTALSNSNRLHRPLARSLRTDITLSYDTHTPTLKSLSTKCFFLVAAWTVRPMYSGTSSSFCAALLWTMRVTGSSDKVRDSLEFDQAYSLAARYVVSSGRDEYVPIPEERLAAMCARYLVFGMSHNSGHAIGATMFTANAVINH